MEAYVVLQECLEMRKRYIFREAIAPWEKEVISDPSTPKPNPEPFFYTSEGKSDVSPCVWFWHFVELLAQNYFISFLFGHKHITFFFHSIILRCKMGLFMYIQIKIVSHKIQLLCIFLFGFDS